MRVIAGRLGGRQFDSPGSHKTRPMSDKMRGALFNILGDIAGLRVLDAFGGSGAISFEAISRGAKQAVIVEQDKPAQRVITRNLASLGLRGHCKLIQASAGAWLQTSQDDFDIVLCDPPYNDLQPSLLNRLTERVRPDGLYVLSYPAAQPAPELDGMEQIKQQHYGDAQLIFYRKT